MNAYVDACVYQGPTQSIERVPLYLEKDLDDLLQDREEPAVVDPDAALEQGEDGHHLG